MRVDIALGGLLAAQSTWPRAPALETLLARGDAEPPGAASLSAWLLARFGIGSSRAASPVAPFTLLADGFPPGARAWLRADPVHLVADRAVLLLAPLPPGDLSAGEAQALAATLAPHLAREGLVLHVGHAERWYIGCDEAPDVSVLPPGQALGPLDQHHLPGGRDAARWRRLLTEVQMLMHDHPVNQAREAAGRAVVNGLWLWGAGRLDDHPVTARDDVVFSDHPLAIGLAGASAIATRPLPQAVESLVAAARPGLRVLLVPDLPATESQVDHCERTWFAPLLAAMRARRLASIGVSLLPPGPALGCRATRTDLRRFWRRPRPLARHV